MIKLSISNNILKICEFHLNIQRMTAFSQNDYPKSCRGRLFTFLLAAFYSVFSGLLSSF
ncbi:hypothetical protein SAMN05216383_12336 [Prevotella sp. KH2C16]|nr:hypothetical protein SAMN05216383_12336 [Prevotella sp. KH2C16]